MIVVLATLLPCFFQRCAHDLPEVPVYVLVYRSGRDPALSQLPPHSEPSPHDAFARRPGLPGLRLVGVLDSALLAFRRMAAPHADTVFHSYGIFAVPGLCKYCGAYLLAGQTASVGFCPLHELACACRVIAEARTFDPMQRAPSRSWRPSCFCAEGAYAWTASPSTCLPCRRRGRLRPEPVWAREFQRSGLPW